MSKIIAESFTPYCQQLIAEENKHCNQLRIIDEELAMIERCTTIPTNHMTNLRKQHSDNRVRIEANIKESKERAEIARGILAKSFVIDSLTKKEISFLLNNGQLMESVRRNLTANVQYYPNHMRHSVQRYERLKGAMERRLQDAG